MKLRFYQIMHLLGCYINTIECFSATLLDEKLIILEPAIHVKAVPSIKTAKLPIIWG